MTRAPVPALPPGQLPRGPGSAFADYARQETDGHRPLFGKRGSLVGGAAQVAQSHKCRYRAGSARPPASAC